MGDWCKLGFREFQRNQKTRSTGKGQSRQPSFLLGLKGQEKKDNYHERKVAVVKGRATKQELGLSGETQIVLTPGPAWRARENVSFVFSSCPPYYPSGVSIGRPDKKGARESVI